MAVGESGTILTSTDGSTWTVRDSGTEITLYGVASDNETFVAVGAAGIVVTSHDGVTSGSAGLQAPKNGFLGLLPVIRGFSLR